MLIRTIANAWVARSPQCNRTTTCANLNFACILKFL